MDIITRLINKYGKPAQVMQTIEEMTELTKELLKNINRRTRQQKRDPRRICRCIIYARTNKRDIQFKR